MAKARLLFLAGFLVLPMCYQGGSLSSGDIDTGTAGDTEGDTDADVDTDSEGDSESGTAADTDCIPDPDPDTTGWPGPGPHGLQWVAIAGGEGNDEPHSVVSFGDGGCVVAGQFQQAITFGTDEPNEKSWSGVDGGFVARFFNDGTLAWVGGLLGEDDSLPVFGAVAVDSGGSILAVGDYHGSAFIEDGEGTEYPLIPAADRNMVMSRFSSSGALEWFRLSSGGSIRIGDAEVRVDGSMLVAGEYSGDVVLNPGEPAETTIESFNSSAFVARVDDTGGVLWVLEAEGYTSFLESISIADDDTFVAAGLFLGEELTLGAGEVNECTLGSAAYSSNTGWTARFSADGSLLWAQAVWSNDIIKTISATTHDDGSVILYGSYNEAIVLAPEQPQEITLSTYPGEAAFLALYDAEGTLAWAQNFQSTGVLRVVGVTAFSDLSYLTAATFDDTVTVDPDGPGETHFATTGDYDTLVSQYNADHELLWAGHDVIGDHQGSVSDIDAANGSAFYFTGVFGTAMSWGIDDCLETTFGPNQVGQKRVSNNESYLLDVFVGRLSVPE